MERVRLSRGVFTLAPERRGARARKPQNSTTIWRRRRRSATTTANASPSSASASYSDEDLERIIRYNEEMQRKMGWDKFDPFKYNPERGLFFHEVAPSLLCGTQPRSPYEVAALQEEHGVTHIVCLQQDQDAEHWGVDLRSVIREAEKRGVSHARAAARDFDPHSLRKVLPAAVRAIDQGMTTSSSSSPSRVYVHCTAGLGRAPAACIAWLKWFGGLDLQTAAKQVTSIRPCGPKTDAVRGATYDLAHVPGVTPAFESLPIHAFSDISAEERKVVQEKVRSWGG